MENRFLHDFMKRQATLITSGIPEEPTTKKTKKPKFGTRDGKHPFGGDDMEARLATIVKERPAKKEVLAYFRDRIAECAADNF
jgi:hypothetical protein